MEKPWARHVYHLFVVRTKEREALASYLKSHKIGTLVHYPTPIHLQEVYQRLGYKKGSFPEVERAASEILSLPIYPTMKDTEVVEVSNTIKAYYSR